MKRAVPTICAALLCAGSMVVALAQDAARTTATVPRMVKFSGTLTSANGQPLSGVVGVTFSLYEEEHGGAALWMETQNVEADDSGHYTVMLGATRNEGIPAQVLASEQGRWLGVEPQGGIEQPRALLVSVPYALKASDADTLGGKPASAYLLARPAVSEQPATSSAIAPPVQPGAAASVKTAGIPRHDFTSSGTTNYIPKFTDTTGDIGNSGLFQNGNNIGLGTTAAAIPFDIRPTPGSPYAQLGVAQTVDYMTLFASDTYGPAFYWDPTKALRFGKGGTGLYNANGFVEYMRIQPNGYVGIGTMAPATTLEVNGSAQVDQNLTLLGNILASGTGLLQAPNNGSANLTLGLYAMTALNTTGGVQNTAIGDGALAANTSGTYNLAVGANALYSNTTGSGGAAAGYGALLSNTTGAGNTAMGYEALYANTTGAGNTGFGHGALYQNTTASANTAVGDGALGANTTGATNTAVGDGALFANTTGSDNVGLGQGALASCTTGAANTVVGTAALPLITSGNGNTALGYQAGLNLTSGSENIYIVNAGAATESGVIRIGTPTSQTSAYIAGIYGVTTSKSNAVPVMIDSNGNLGTVSSSRRYKEDIQNMADSSSGLLRLRPVTFRYKKPFDDGSKPIQYGLIAEEVEEVYPDLVAHSADGQIETVKYQVLAPMLLNELQKQNTTIAAQKEQIRDQQQEIRSLEERLAKVEAVLERTSLSASK